MIINHQQFGLVYFELKQAYEALVCFIVCFPSFKVHCGLFFARSVSNIFSTIEAHPTNQYTTLMVFLPKPENGMTQTMLMNHLCISLSFIAD